MLALPVEEAGRLRVGALRQTATNGRDLVPAHLANRPDDDPLDPGFPDGVIAGLEPRHQDVARDVGAERGDAATFVRHQALEILLDGGLAHTRGHQTGAAWRIDHRIVGKEGERPCYIATG